MMYPYITLGDGTEICHSQLMKEGDQKKVVVHFERPNDEGDFDTARCELPSYTWLIQKGYSDEEIALFTRFLESNAHLLYRFAAAEGVHC